MFYVKQLKFKYIGVNFVSFSADREVEVNETGWVGYIYS